MPRLLKLNSMVCLGLAAVFSVFFMYLKHDPALSPIVPFGEDPYDAVGSFADEAVIVFSILAIVRAFWPANAEDASRSRQLRLARTEMAVPLAVLITLASNVVAMARHTAMWAAAASGTLLLGLQLGMFLLALGVSGMIWLQARRIDVVPPHAYPWARALVVFLAGVAVLAAYPERVRESVPGALITVVTGALVLFASLWAIGTAILPDGQVAVTPAPFRPAWWSRRRFQWGIVVLLAVATGLLLVAAESTEGGGGPIPLAQLVFVASVYVGLEITAVIIAFAFLRKWLGLFQ